MYAYIRGTVEEVGLDSAVLEANGVGYLLNCSAMTLKKLQAGDTAKLHTYLYLADGIMALYGFGEEAEREMFRKLLGVTRVGPKLALAVLSKLTPTDVCTAVVTNTPAAFDTVSGCGRKTAQRIILELAETVRSETAVPVGATEAKSANDLRSEAIAALTSLGYDGLSASRAVAAVEESDSVEDMITKALRSMARG